MADTQNVKPVGAGDTVFLNLSGNSRMDFAQSDISNAEVTDDGHLRIDLAAGGTLVISNFESLAARGTQIGLSDGSSLDLASFSGHGTHNINTAGPLGGTTQTAALFMPAPGDSKTIELPAGKTVRLGFGPEALQDGRVQDDTLIMPFKNGGEIILKGYEGDEFFQLMDGTVISGTDLLTSIHLARSLPEDELQEDDASPVSQIRLSQADTTQDLNEIAKTLAQTSPAAGQDMNQIARELAQTEPAAGPGAGIAGARGYGFNSRVDDVSLLNVNAVGPINPTALQYGIPTFEQKIFIPAAAVAMRSPVSTLDVDLTVNNNVANAQVKEDYSVDVDMSAIATNGSGSEVITITISGIDSSWGFTPPAGGIYDSAAGTWTYTTTAGQSFAETFTFTPPADSDIDLTKISVTADVSDPVTGLTGTDSDSFDIIVDAVADAPTLTANGAVGNIGTPIPLVITTAVTDTDGSETIDRIEISNLPAGATLNNYQSYDSSTGTWTLDVADLTGLTITVPSGNSGSYNLKIVSYSTENPVSDSEYDYSDNEASTTAYLGLCVDCDDVPVVTSPTEAVDESNFPANLTASGTLSVNYGVDSAGTIAGNNSYTTSTTLYSKGSAVTITYNGTTQTYTGTSGDGRTIFTLTIDNNGNYTYTQFDQLDHPVAGDPDDIIRIDFGVIVTDDDGDSTTGEITINISDDGPLAVNDSNTVQESIGHVSGNLLTNDDIGADEDGVVVSVSGQTLSGGSVTINGTYGTLTVDQNGTYTYTITAANPPATTETFSYTMTDADGDPSTAQITITLDVCDDNPVILKPLYCWVDETILDNTGSDYVASSFSGDFGADGPGTLGATGTYSYTGNAGSSLKSNGYDVTITYAGGTWTGTSSDGRPVFKMVVNTDGTYRFDLYDQMDHVDATDNNDAIVFEFGIFAKDADGDTATDTLTIKVYDDGPVAVNDSNTVLESVGHISGNLLTNDDIGADENGIVTIAGGQNLSGGPVTLSGTYGTLTVHANGAYTYTLTAANPPATTETFTYTMTDADGDPSSAQLTITINNDDDQPVLAAKTDSVDETDRHNNGTESTSGSLFANFYNDGAGPFEGISGSFSYSGSYAGISLASKGDAVIVTYNSTTQTYTGTATGTASSRPVFTLLIETDGDYTFTLLDQLDHGNPNDPDDDIVLSFGTKVTDADGDSDTSTLKITVNDDGVTANDDVNAYNVNLGTTSGNVITGLNGGPGAADDPGEDDPVLITNVSGTNVPGTGTVDIHGTYGTLTIAADGSYSYTLDSNWQDTAAHDFTETLEFPVLVEGQRISGTQLNNLGILPDALDISYDSKATVTFVSEAAGYSNTLGVYTVNNAGEITGVEFVLVDTNAAATGGSVVVDVPATTNQQSLGLFLIADGYDVNTGYSGIDLTTGTLSFVYQHGTAAERTATINDDGNDVSLVYTDAVGNDTVLQGSIYHTTERGSSADLNSDDEIHIVSGLATAGDSSVLRIGFEDKYKLGDEDYNDVIFDLSLRPGCPIDTFDYTLTDSDGDSDTATLTFKCDGNSQPLLLDPALKTTDETDLYDNGTESESGTLYASLGNDGPGTFEGINNSFQYSGSYAGPVLFSKGETVTVTYDSNTGTYTGTAGSRTVFTLVIQSNGDYTFRLLDQLDHKDTTNADDTISLEFGVKVTDQDGDTDTSTLTVNVKDDGPVAADDANTVQESIGHVSGNLLNNDDARADENGSVASVAGQSLSGGPVTVNGTYGTLTVNATGSYTYTLTATNPPATTETFTYTMADADGDRANAELIITIDADDDQPVLSAASETVNETDLYDNSTESESGTLSASLGLDGPGIFEGVNNSFQYSGSYAGPVLFSKGETVTVTYDSNTGTYTGTAGSRTVFTLVIQSNGDYTFRLLDQLDHKDTTNADDVITLKFGTKVTDQDGDTDTSTLTVNVKDDGPVAADDANTVQENPGYVSGNLLNNDDARADEDGTVTIAGGQNLNGGSVTINGTYGTLTVNANGSYTYTLTATNPPVTTEIFHYTMVDADGDPATAKLTITVDAIDDQPILGSDCQRVDETDMYDTGNPVVINSAVTVDYGADPAGEVAGTDNFSYSGSYAGPTLSSKGFDVTSSYNVATRTYTGTSTDGRVIFTLLINADGTYTFTLMDQLDHADLANPDDTLYLHFGIKATDADGDSVTNSINIYVDDDGPVAVNDTATVYESTSTASGNLLTNDDIGADENGSVVTISGQTVTSSGTTVFGTYGYLTVSNNGAYTYTLTASNPPNTTETFSYTMVDADGDPSSATLTLSIVDNDDVPSVTSPLYCWVDECLLPYDYVSSNMTGDFGNDGPGSFAATGVYSYTGAANGALTSRGVAVDVTFSNGTWTGAANGSVVFTMQVKSNGQYTMKLYDILDHADPSDGWTDSYGYVYGSAITFKFQTIATDNDGDTAYHDLTMKVVNDGSTYQLSSPADDGTVYIMGSSGSDVIRTDSSEHEILYGNNGADIFDFDSIGSGQADVIKDFDINEGDGLNFADIIAYADPVTSAINDYVFATEVSGNTVISIDTSGSGNAANATDVVVLEGVTGLNLEDAINQGQI